MHRIIGACFSHFDTTAGDEDRTSGFASFAFLQIRSKASCIALRTARRGVILRDRRRQTGCRFRCNIIDSQHERLWEQSADLSLHQDMFAVASMLNSFNAMAFPVPDALRVTLSIQCDDVSKLALFNSDMDLGILVWMISAGMNESAILNRLSGDQIATGKVADADSIVLEIADEQRDPAKLQIRIASSAYWSRHFARLSHLNRIQGLVDFSVSPEVQLFSLGIH